MIPVRGNPKHRCSFLVRGLAPTEWSSSPDASAPQLHGDPHCIWQEAPRLLSAGELPRLSLFAGTRFAELGERSIGKCAYPECSCRADPAGSRDERGRGPQHGRTLAVDAFDERLKTAIRWSRVDLPPARQAPAATADTQGLFAAAHAFRPGWDYAIRLANATPRKQRAMPAALLTSR